MLWNLLILLCVGSSFTRDAKWLFPQRRLTSIVRKINYVTKIVPSSCVVIDSTLPTCRNVRKLQIDPSPPNSIESTAIPDMVGPRGYELEATETERNWGGFWGDYWGNLWAWPQEIVTRTKIIHQTIRHTNPNDVVSIVFKGCQPTNMPFNLTPCSNDTSNAPQQKQRELHYTNE